MANEFFSYGAPPPAPAPTPTPGAAPVRLLADLGDEDWEKFIGFTAQRRYPAGAAIVRAGERAPALFLVASGSVRVLLPGNPPAVRGEGEVVGLLSFLDGAPHAADVLAIDAVELLMLTPDALTQLAAWQPRIALALLRDLGAHAAARLRRLQPGD
jgi:CRP-like cAMP-binding protein